MCMSAYAVLQTVFSSVFKTNVEEFDSVCHKLGVKALVEECRNNEEGRNCSDCCVFESYCNLRMPSKTLIMFQEMLEALRKYDAYELKCLFTKLNILKWTLKCKAGIDDLKNLHGMILAGHQEADNENSSDNKKI